ncbi:hypothetical protein [Streptosporangium sp. 'caverna']|uniref:hypothetical protein n=1 Tax=Streptosporangium sp. 'caverna' TaxID=2202249 RepID=UPI000D7E2319|nr:hypothetical protein [Streptosporangium sp. 'caverna']AWS45021.1 hypothetical protein DKM19_30615 [Streptosporangium sp. 'caverna']
MRTTIVSLAALAMVAFATPAVHAEGHEHRGQVRYAWLKECTKKDESTYPCGKWQLALHGGGMVTLGNARIFPLDSRGKVNDDGAAQVAVSGDGSHVAYFRQSDGRLAVEKVGGAVRRLPASVVPKGLGMLDVAFHLSQDGSRLAVWFGGASVRPTRIYDTASGALLAEISQKEMFEGFSGDAGEVLFSRQTDENVFRFGVYDTAGNELLRADPPRIVSGNSPYGLAADGRTVAVFVDGKRPAIALHDLESGQTTGSVPVRIGGRSQVEAVDWTGVNQVTVHTVESLAKERRVRVLEVDVATGVTKVRDHYTIRGAYGFAACGG